MTFRVIYSGEQHIVRADNIYDALHMVHPTRYVGEHPVADAFLPNVWWVYHTYLRKTISRTFIHKIED